MKKADEAFTHAVLFAQMGTCILGFKGEIHWAWMLLPIPLAMAFITLVYAAIPIALFHVRRWWASRGTLKP